ncbi:MAG: endonuclease/exonuclease/phosphatase family protein [Planctomycetes bacterium]|nr:endonuclease/exonuclease/phosphatase family protein [Planctomycetota bacterium]
MKRRWLHRLVFVLLSVLSLLAVAVFVGALAASAWPQFEQLSNLRSYVSIVLVGVGCLWFVGKRILPKGLLVGALLCAMGLFGLTPALALIGGGDEVDEAAAELRIGSVNLLFGIGHPDPVGAWMGAEDLHVVGFLEMKDSPRSKLRWPRLLESWKDDYPYQVVEPHPYYGMGLLSKWPMSDVKVTYGAGGNGEESERPMRLQATVMFEGRPVRLCLVHPPRPSQTWRGGVRQVYFDQLATELTAPGSKGEAQALVVFGDLNATEGSPLFQSLKRRVGLRDSRQGFGYLPSWRPHYPDSYPDWLECPLLPLDHILVRGLGVKTRGVGPDVRSDHRPIHATLTWPKATTTGPSPR